MSRQAFFRLIVAMTLLLTTPMLLPTWASPLRQGKEPGGYGIQSTPTVAIQNEYIRAMSSNGGRFVIGTTGGDPRTSNDDNKRLLYGYPTNVGSSFSTLRIVNSTITSDYRLGSTSWESGIAPIAPPTSDGTTITTIWEKDGVRVEEKLYFAQNSDTGRMDTTAIEYTLRNNNSSNRDIGLRIMLDVMVGNNDGAPYLILGVGQVTRQAEWRGVNVPEYWVAYESATFNPVSLKARGQLAGGNAVRPDRFIVADWPQAHRTVWDYTVDPNDSVTNDSAIILYYNPVTLGPGQTKIYRTYYGIARSGETAQIELTGLEVTQAIQNWENDVVLIQDRPTFVRAHVRSTSGGVDDVTAELIGRRDGSPLPGSPLQPANRGGNIDVLEKPDRLQLMDSFYFELPASWRSGTIELEFRGVNRTIVCRERAGIDDDCKAQVTFSQSPPADIRLVGIAWRENGVRHEPTWDDIRQVVQEIESTFPIPRLNWDSPYGIELVFSAGQPRGRLQFIGLNSMLKIHRTLDGCISSWPVNCKRYYLGILVDPPTFGVWGWADGIPADVATAYLTNDFFTPPHELGHLTGRYHTNCKGDEARADSSYPYPGGKISRDTSGDNAFFGFDINTKRIYSHNTGDLMSYCRPIWPSDWTYRHIRDHLVSRYSQSTSRSLAVLSGDPAILVSGVVTPTAGTGRLQSVLTVESPASVSSPASGTYEIRFEDNAGQTLASYSFEPDYGVDSCVGCPADIGSTVGTFAFLLPRNARTARIVLLRNGQALDSRLASAHTPSVTVEYPNGGESLTGPTATLKWSANDPDGDTLEYTIQYSVDAGTSWQTLVSGWQSATYELNLGLIAGTNQGLLRVLASDGFHTAQDQSNGTFSVARHAPQASIRTPVNDSMYVATQTVILEGSAYDNEDGQLGDAALTWSSNLNGVLGTGRSLAINASALAEGTHTITLTARDSDGQTGNANLTIRIYRTRPVLAASLAVAPAELRFTSRLNGGQTDWQSLSIRNSGDGTIIWSASADQGWIRVSSPNGTAPTDILVAADPTGLAIGQYTGRIAVTASGAAGSPQIIQVTFLVQTPQREVYLPVIMK